MPVVQANGIDVYYEVQGEGEPLVLIPYLAADQACYAFQVADYAKSFTCFTVDLRGAGLSGKPEGRYSTELFADDVAAFMQAAGVGRAHVAGLSLGAAAGIWLAAKYPDRVTSLSLHSAWMAPTRSCARWSGAGGSWPRPGQRDGDGDPGHLPVVLHAELYAARPDTSSRLADFVRSGRCRRSTRSCASRRRSGPRRAGVLGSMQAPTLITFGRHDQVTSTRFAARSPRDRAHRARRLRGLLARPDLRETSRRSTRHPDFLHRHHAQHLARHSGGVVSRRMDETYRSPRG